MEAAGALTTPKENTNACDRSPDDRRKIAQGRHGGCDSTRRRSGALITTLPNIWSPAEPLKNKLRLAAKPWPIDYNPDLLKFATVWCKAYGFELRQGGKHTKE